MGTGSLLLDVLQTNSLDLWGPLTQMFGDNAKISEGGNLLSLQLSRVPKVCAGGEPNRQL